jgi:hypothetical protein
VIPVCDFDLEELIKFTTTSLKVAEMSIPAYSCRYSKHIYTQHQHMALICLMKRLRLKYREIVQLVTLMPKIQEILDLSKIPHFTTLQKFFKRFGSRYFDDMLEQTIALFDIQEPLVAVDGTGHATDQASLYYAKKIEKQTKKRRKSYTKNQIAIDTHSQAILAHKVVRGPRHDMKDAIATIRKTKKFKPSGFCLDKAFDSEEIHTIINEEFKVTAMIPAKKRTQKGKYRVSMQYLFSKPRYHQRSKVESVFSVEKRVFGDKNNSRSDRLRNKESKLRNVCYNIYRHAKVFIIQILKGFLQSHLFIIILIN